MSTPRASAETTAPTAPPEPEFHSLANIFPLLDGEEFKGLIEDIKKNGLQQPITMYAGMVLDGRNRFRACKEAGKELRFVDLPTSANPLAFVISANLHRRHLNETQRGIVAARLANMRVGGKEANPSKDGNVSQEDAAKLLNVSLKTVERASKLVKGDAPNLVALAEQGKVKVSSALRFMKKPEQERKNLLTEKGGDIVEAVKAAGSCKSDGADTEPEKTKPNDNATKTKYRKQQEELIDTLMEFVSLALAEDYAEQTKTRLGQTIKQIKEREEEGKKAAQAQT